MAEKRMYLPKDFKRDDPTVLRAELARPRLATPVTLGSEGSEASHVPMLHGLWEIVAFYIRSMLPVLQAVEHRERVRRRRSVAAKAGSIKDRSAIQRPSST